MISYADYIDVDALDNTTRAQVARLFERADTLHDLPDDLGTVEAWDELIEDCERVGFPHLVATARISQCTILVKGGLAAEALEVFVALMRTISRYGDLIAPSNVALHLNSVGTTAMTLVDDPRVPLERITRLIDLVEQEMRRRGVDVTGAYVARAAVAAAAGDGGATLGWIDRWRAESGDGWRADDGGVIQMEIPLIARFDVDRAADTLEQRLRLLGIDPHALDAGVIDRRGDLNLLALHGFLRVRQGRRAEATAIGDALVAAVGSDVLAREAVASWVIPVLEERPEAAGVVVDHVLAESALDGTDWETVAAVGRHRILLDPDGEEGELLRALAQEGAEQHDRRGGTRVHERELDELWWAGLPQARRPAVVDDPEIWGDVETRAERILAAGWFERTGLVRSDDPPISLKYRYQALLGETMELFSAESASEADALADRLRTRAGELRCATSLFLVPLLHGLRAGQAGDTATLVSSYSRAQQELAAGSAWVVDEIRAMGERFFATVVEQAVACPDVAWEEIDRLIADETEVRAVTRAPVAPLLLVRAEIAAHRGDVEQLRTELGELGDCLLDEVDQLDREAIGLEMVRLVARYSPGLATSLASQITLEGDAEQIRAATTWLAWLHPEDGSTTDRFAQVLASVDDDVTSLGVVPGWVVLEVVARTGRDPRPVVDALLADVDGGTASDLGLIAASGAALLATAPEDPRGPELRERALGIARGLDARDGGTRATAWVGERWYRGDAAFVPGTARP